MKTYLFRCKKILFWQKYKVTGHKLENGVMVLFKEDGGIETIPEWHKYKMKLGSDWALTVKENIQKNTGVDFKTNA